MGLIINMLANNPDRKLIWMIHILYITCCCVCITQPIKVSEQNHEHWKCKDEKSPSSLWGLAWKILPRMLDQTHFSSRQTQNKEMRDRFREHRDTLGTNFSSLVFRFKWIACCSFKCAVICSYQHSLEATGETTPHSCTGQVDSSVIAAALRIL